MKTSFELKDEGRLHQDECLLGLEKLPNTIKLQISQKLGKENWNIEQFLPAINQEITARENFEYLKQNTQEKSLKIHEWERYRYPHLFSMNW